MITLGIKSFMDYLFNIEMKDVQLENKEIVQLQKHLIVKSLTTKNIQNKTSLFLE